MGVCCLPFLYCPPSPRALAAGFGSLYGQPVGVVANNGIIFGECAQKGAHFVQLCAQRGIPLIFLHNVSGGRCAAEGVRDLGQSVQAPPVLQHCASHTCLIVCWG